MKVHLRNPIRSVSNHVAVISHLEPVIPPVDPAYLLFNKIERGSLQRNVVSF